MSRHVFESVTIVVLAFVLNGACYAQPTVDDVTREEGAPPRASQSELLRVASSNSPDARSRIQAIADSAPGADTRALARAILSLWDEQLNTYSSTEARYLTYATAAMPPPVFAIAEIVVSEEGRPIRVTVTRIDQPERTPEVESFLMNRIYLPARVDGAYIQSEAAALLRPEVR